MKRLLCGLLILFSTPILSKELPLAGSTFPVQEMSLLDLIAERLKTLTEEGQLQALERQWTKRVANHANRPNPLSLGHREKLSIHYYTPEVILKDDIRDAKGRVLFHAGTRINALSQLPAYSPCWLFFNNDDLAERQWAMKAMYLCQNPKIILTGGAIHDAEKTFKMAIYFDQGARITKKLAIRSLPALVLREDNRLKIAEIAIKENGDAL